MQLNYKARFQIEFLFRDAKQFTELNQCQARSQNKNSHINISLTAIGVAQIAHYSEKDHSKTPFSIADIKTPYFNELMLDLIFSNLQIDPKLIKNKYVINKFIQFDSIAA